MLNIMGDDYISQHIENELYKQSQEMLFRTYVTDALMAISAHDQKMTKRYADILKKAFDRPDKEETARDIKDRILTGLKRIMRKEDEQDG